MPLVRHRQAHGHAGGAGHPDVCTRHRDRGFDRAAVVRVLTDETYLAEVKADVAQAAEYGIQGVPFFVIDGTYGVSGAQDATTFADVLERARTEREAIQ